MHRLPPRTTLTLLAGLIIAAASLLALPAGGAHAGGPIVRVSPAAQTVSAGNNIDVNIIVSGAPSFGAYEFHLAFDPNVLTFVSITMAETFIESTGREAFCFGPEPEDLLEAIVSYACGTTGVQAGPSGEGTLARVRFSTFCAGSSDLKFVPIDTGSSFTDPVSISTILGVPIPTDSQNGAATVTGQTACAGALPGDSSCDGVIDPIDAAIILQFAANLLTTLGCPENADVNGDGSVDAIDAALILQYSAGLIGTLPP